LNPQLGGSLSVRNSLSGVNDFFARYLIHLNREEADLVPLMNRIMTDDQITSIWNAMAGHLTADRCPSFMKWQVTPLNVTELTELFMWIKREIPDLLGPNLALAESTVDANRFSAVKKIVGI
jgi:hypothetical protein